MNGIKVGGLNVTDLRYADDTSLITKNEEDLQEIVIKVQEEGV